jgi:hypothetical protein
VISSIFLYLVQTMQTNLKSNKGMNILRPFSLLMLAFLTIQYGCVEGEKSAPTDEEISDAGLDSNRTKLLNVGGAIFSIPSPVQTAVLIKNSGASYDGSLGNSVKNVGNYVTAFNKSLVMGIYGADLAYATIFDKNQEAINYLGAIEKLSNDLELSNAVDQSIVKRFTRNMGKQDSLLVLSSVFFRKTDMYLKENDRAEVAALVLAGGWIEGLFLAYNSSTGNEQVRQRIAEQKPSLESLIDMLGEDKANPEAQKLVEQLNLLKAEFDTVTSTYEYQRPETDATKRVTTINSSTRFDMSEEQLSKIGSLIEEIRNNIVG